MRVRLWSWWAGPGAWHAPGEVVVVAPMVALELCSHGMGEMVGPDSEVATVGPRERAVKHKTKRGKSRAG